MFRSTAWTVLAAFVVVICCFAFPAFSAVEMATVTVGNPGNAADTNGYGAVDYSFDIGKYEVTAGQYTEFLTAVASNTDPYGLYSEEMLTDDEGCKI